MLQCVKLFGEIRGQQIQDLVESSIGQECPCKRNLRCPLLPLDSGDPVPLLGPPPLKTVG